MNRKQEERRKEFKKTLDVDDLRRRRNSQTDQLRKSKREESLMKRRTIQDNTMTTSNGELIEGGGDGRADAATAILELGDASQQRQLLKAFESDDFDTVFAATTQIRRMLSIEREPPIDEVLALGVLPRLVQYSLAAEKHPKLALEALWAITNIASGTSMQTRAVVEAGAVPALVQLLAAPTEAVRDQAVWALGNIAGDGAELRDLCLQHNVMAGLLYQYTLRPEPAMQRNTTWALSNLCRGKPAPAFALVAPCVGKLVELLHTCTDDETLIDAVWALSYLTDGDNDKIQVVVEAGACAKLVELLSHSKVAMQTPALRAVGNIVTGTEEQTQAIIALNPFKALGDLLFSKKKSIVKEASWCLSNITAGTPSQVEAAVRSGVMPLLAHVLSNGDNDCKKEACWAISNATSGGSIELTRQWIEQEIVRGLVDMMRYPEVKIQLVTLEALENILDAGETMTAMGSKQSFQTNPFAEWVVELDGCTQLEQLQDHANEKIYNTAARIISKFFQEENDEADPNSAENLAPNVVAGTGGPAQFVFGVTKPGNNNFSFAF